MESVVVDEEVRAAALEFVGRDCGFDAADCRGDGGGEVFFVDGALDRDVWECGGAEAGDGVGGVEF